MALFYELTWNTQRILIFELIQIYSKTFILWVNKILKTSFFELTKTLKVFYSLSWNILHRLILCVMKIIQRLYCMSQQNIQIICYDRLHKYSQTLFCEVTKRYSKQLRNIYIWSAVTPCVYLLARYSLFLENCFTLFYYHGVDCSGVRETSQFWKELSCLLTITWADGIEIGWDYYFSL